MPNLSTSVLKLGFVVIAVAVFAGCNTSPAAKEAKFLQHGKVLMDRKDFERALLEFRNASHAVPADAEPYYQMGLAHLGNGDAGNALRAFQKAVVLNPKHAGAQLKIAEFAGTTQDARLIQESVSRLTSVFGISPTDPDVINVLALDEWKLGNTAQASQRLEDALKKFPTHLQSSVALARLKLTARDFKAAEEILKQAVSAAPQSSPAAAALGQFYVYINDLAKGGPELKRAVQLDAKNGSALITLAALQVAAKQPDAAEKTYRQVAALPEKEYKPLHAIFLYQSGKRDAALAEFEALAKADPEDRGPRTRLISAYLGAGRRKDAEAVIAAALKRNPKDAEALLQRAQLRLRDGNADGAEKDLAQVLAFMPDSAPAHFFMSEVFRSRSLENSQRQELQRALDLDPKLLEARLTLEARHLSSNEPTVALGLINAAPEYQKRDVRWLVGSAWALLANGNLQEAKSTVDKALAQGRPPDAVFQAAVLRILQRDYAGARQQVDELLKRGIADVNVAELLMKTYTEQKDTAKGVERLKEVAAANPSSAPLQHLLGQWFERSGKTAEARKAFEAAKAADPKFLPADLAIADGELSAGQNDSARQRLVRAVEANPSSIPVLLMAARADEQAGDRASAIARYRAVIGLDGTNLVALNNLAYALAFDRPDEALHFGQQALENAPDSPNVQDTLGWVYYRKKLYSMAVGYLKTAAAKDPVPQRQYHLGMAYMRSGEKALGERLVNEALRKDPALLNTERGW